MADQRSGRQMVFSSSKYDVISSRNTKDTRVVANKSSSTPTNENSPATSSPMPKRLRRSCSTEKDEDAPLQLDKLIPIKQLQIPSVVREGQRYSVGSRAKAAICNGLLKDLGIGSAENIIDRNKIVRQSQKHNEVVRKTYEQNAIAFTNKSQSFGLFFDGKKDDTKIFVLNEETSRNHLPKTREEHYTLVIQPNNKWTSDRYFKLHLGQASKGWN